MYTDSFIVYIKTDDIYKDIAEYVETRFDTSIYELDRPLPKVIGLMKDELGGEIKTKFVGIRAKTYSYLKDDRSEDKKAKGTKKCVIKWKLKFENYANCLEATQRDNKIKYLEKNEINIDNLWKNKKKLIRNNKSILKTQQGFKSEGLNDFTEEINKIALSPNDVKECNHLIR